MALLGRGDSFQPGRAAPSRGAERRPAMPNISACPQCGRLYEAGSEEQANEPDRRCPWCIGPDAVARYRHPNHRTESERRCCSYCAQWDAADEQRGSRCGPACG